MSEPTSAAEDMPIAVIVLAAGRGERFVASGGSGSKLMQTIVPGRVVAEESLLRLAAGLGADLGVRSRDVAPRVVMRVVVRPGDVDLAALFRRASDVDIVESVHADEGMGAALADGVLHMAAGTAVLVALADMPWLHPASVQAVLQALREGASIARPRVDGLPGHPVGFAPQWLGALQQLRADEGARAIVRAHAGDVRHLDTDDLGCVLDIDQRGDLRAPPGWVPWGC